MDCKEELKQKLKKYSEDDIVFTTHALLRAKQRNIGLDEVKDNIINPMRLSYAEKQESHKLGEEKYNCYFLHSKV